MLIVENIFEKYGLKQNSTFQSHHLNMLLFILPKFPLCEAYIIYIKHMIHTCVQYIALCDIC